MIQEIKIKNKNFLNIVMVNQPAISVKNLNKIYGKNSLSKKVALNNINLDIPKGSIFGLLGPNGAGKSTFINILADLVRKTSGEVNILGIDHEKDLKKVKALMGIVPQELNIDPFFTPYEILEIQAGLYGVPKENRKTDQILEMLALSDKSKAYARTLSGGMRRRLLIAKAMVHDPEILILDEPTAGVDVELRSNLWDSVHLLNSKGKTIILTTHYLHEAEELCDTIAIIDKGKLVACDTKTNIKSFINNKKIIMSYKPKDNFNISELRKMDLDIEYNENNIVINYVPDEIDFDKILQKIQKTGIEVIDMNIKESNLEDVFLKLTKN
tara:strand:- start:5890 stop:6870 length:981 start_codon:yes stop_codon:yes gene_type:complete